MRGSLEQVTAGRVRGWVYSAAEPVRDSLILAFAGSECVGAGRVEIFRQDLADAGLGDGFLGYSFPINLPQSALISSVVVRLDTHEAVFLQGDSTVTTKAVLSGLKSASIDLAEARAWRTHAVKWLFDQGRLAQTEYDFLRSINQFGGYVRTLRGSTGATSGERAPIDVAKAVEENLAVLHMADVRVIEHKITAIAELGSLLALASKASNVPVVAIWSKQKVRVGIIEGSHADGSGEGPLAECPQGAIDLVCGPEHLLFLDLRCTFGARSAALKGDLLVYTAERVT